MRVEMTILTDPKELDRECECESVTCACGTAAAGIGCSNQREVKLRIPAWDLASRLCLPCAAAAEADLQNVE